MIYIIVLNQTKMSKKIKAYDLNLCLKDFESALLDKYEQEALTRKAQSM